MIGQNLPGKLTLFFGFRRGNTFMYQEELEKYARAGKLELIPTISRDDPAWTGKKGYVQVQIAAHNFPTDEKKCAYMCGSPKMIEEVKLAFTQKGFSETDLFVEKW
jgi:CDP-4-dehydro-6-deoxyglucose reductase